MKVPQVIPKERHLCTYTSCYCEENIWKLCDLVREQCPGTELANCFCVFISNENRQIPLWHQKASTNDQRLVVWDYHVILLYEDAGETVVYDLDSELGFPCTLKEYAAACIGNESILKPHFYRKFRVVSASEYLSTFASDRSHMVDDKAQWMSPPPAYPPISTPASSNNIQEFISMDAQHLHGDVHDLKAFLLRFKAQ